MAAPGRPRTQPPAFDELIAEASSQANMNMVVMAIPVPRKPLPDDDGVIEQDQGVGISLVDHPQKIDRGVAIIIGRPAIDRGCSPIGSKRSDIEICSMLMGKVVAQSSAAVTAEFTDLDGYLGMPLCPSMRDVGYGVDRALRPILVVPVTIDSKARALRGHLYRDIAVIGTARRWGRQSSWYRNDNFLLGIDDVGQRVGQKFRVGPAFVLVGIGRRRVPYRGELLHVARLQKRVDDSRYAVFPDKPFEPLSRFWIGRFAEK